MIIILTVCMFILGVTILILEIKYTNLKKEIEDLKFIMQQTEVLANRLQYRQEQTEAWIAKQPIYASSPWIY